MGGMPSARGCEWKGRYDDESHRKFQEAFDRIPRNPDGTMVNEPPVQAQQAPVKNPPVACSECFFLTDCPTECSHGSEDCRKKLGI